MHFERRKCVRNVFAAGVHPRPCWGAYSTFPDLLAGPVKGRKEERKGK